MIDLDNMVFPKSPLKEENLDPEQLKQFLTIRAEFEKSAFVTEGHFEVRSLGPKEFVRPIPENECSITALVNHSSGHVYGATSGKKSHLFYYNPAPDADAVVDIGVVCENDSEIPAIIELPNAVVLGVVNCSCGKAKLFTYRSCSVLLRDKDFTGLGVREIFDLPAEDQLFFSTIDPCHSVGQIEVLNTELPEAMGDLTFDANGTVYLVGKEKGKVYTLNEDMTELNVIGQLDPNGNFSSKFGKIGDRIFACGLYGQIFEVSQEGLRKCACRAASIKGLELYNRVTAWCAFGEVLYGGTIDGVIFAFNPETETVTTLGKPTTQTYVNGMAATGGQLYAIIGLDDDCAHLAVFNPETRDLRDLGCPLAHSERPWNGYVFGSMCRGANGQLFLGECDRISQLFIYYPRVN